MAKSLQGQGHRLAVIERQWEILRPDGPFPPFEVALSRSGHEPLRADAITTLQVNLGKLCNQTCHHCHVDAGPDRREIMDRQTMQSCLDLLDRLDTIETVDLTGGAPEMNPHFEWFVTEIRRRQRHVMDRCNLTILTVGRYRRLAAFLAEQGVEVVASLPCYAEENTDQQRGDGVFTRSIEAIRTLNRLGYGVDGSRLQLNLVYNPNGAFLPPSQDQLEARYRDELRDRYGIIFDRLYVITNMPINRYLECLLVADLFDDYMRLLVESYNPKAIDGLMCRSMISVEWDGSLSDCDFNQQLRMPLEAGFPRHIRDIRGDELAGRRIRTGLHCYGCAAGSGSSCGGAVV